MEIPNSNEVYKSIKALGVNRAEPINAVTLAACLRPGGSTEPLTAKDVHLVCQRLSDMYARGWLARAKKAGPLLGHSGERRQWHYWVRRGAGKPGANVAVARNGTPRKKAEVPYKGRPRKPGVAPAGSPEHRAKQLGNMAKARAAKLRNLAAQAEGKAIIERRVVWKEVKAGDKKPLRVKREAVLKTPAFNPAIMTAPVAAKAKVEGVNELLHKKPIVIDTPYATITITPKG